MDESNNLDISIVIVTKNEERNIEKCILSALSQTFNRDRYEIIIVDAQSDDKTREIAQKYTNKIILSDPSMPKQRNLGLKNSKGKYVLLLDADMRISNDLLQVCFEEMEEDSTLVGLYIEEIILGGRFFHKIRRFERSFYSGTVIDCIRFVRKNEIEKIGFYDERIKIGEDWDLDRRINTLGKTKLIKTPLYHDETLLTLQKYIKKKSLYAGVMNEYREKWPKNDPIIKKQFGSYYRLIGVFLENGKWKKVARHPILFLCMFSMRFIVAILFLHRKVNEKYFSRKTIGI